MSAVPQHICLACIKGLKELQMIHLTIFINSLKGGGMKKINHVYK